MRSAQETNPILAEFISLPGLPPSLKLQARQLFSFFDSDPSPIQAPPEPLQINVPYDCDHQPEHMWSHTKKTLRLVRKHSRFVPLSDFVPSRRL